MPLRMVWRGFWPGQASYGFAGSGRTRHSELDQEHLSEMELFCQVAMDPGCCLVGIDVVHEGSAAGVPSGVAETQEDAAVQVALDGGLAVTLGVDAGQCIVHFP